MKIKIITLLIASLLVVEAEAGTLVFDESGFSIDSLDATPSLSGGQPLQMLLPSVDGFAANINVQIQPYADTITEYRELSESQFKQLGLKAIVNEKKGNSLLFEYTGIMQGRKLHWYSKAVKKGDFVYLVTATEQENNWKHTKDKLISVVNSFKLK